MAPTQTPEPIDDESESTASRLAIAPAWVDPITGATYVHESLAQVRGDWDHVQHIPPISRTEKFGSVESWGEYVLAYAGALRTLLTWSEAGLRAVLDYHSALDHPGRCQWVALHPFERSVQCQQWAGLADGRPRTQKQLVEGLEDLAADIVEPDAATLVAILRTLRGTSKASADTELRPDGTSSIVWTKDQSVRAGELELPGEFQVAIQLLKGHVAFDNFNKAVPVLYRLAVKVRVNVGDDAKLGFRLSMPGAERAFEAVYADRVAAAQAAVGDEYTLLRATA